MELFWTKQGCLFRSEPVAKAVTWGKYAVRVLLIVLPAIFTYWTANYNNRAPTPIDGVWVVAEISPELGGKVALPSTIFFERNRAHLCVFKQKDDSYNWHHFEIDANAQAITIWQQWLQKGEMIFEGHYELSGLRLRSSGRFASQTEEAIITLRKSDK